jgi:hypothetical protein
LGDNESGEQLEVPNNDVPTIYSPSRNNFMTLAMISIALSISGNCRMCQVLHLQRRQILTVAVLKEIL